MDSKSIVGTTAVSLLAVGGMVLSNHIKSRDIGFGGTAGIYSGGAGGSTGSAGNSGKGGTGGVGAGGIAGGGVAGCVGIGGPSMVRVPMGYCIDSTEVTRDQYQAWLNTNPSTAGQISACSWNNSFMPSRDWPPLTNLNYPVTYIDWCDAYTYCIGVGKHLCGKIGGGSNGYADYANANLSQWYAACSMNGTRTYPYGNTYNPATCNGYDSNHGGPISIRALSGCQSYSGLYDMSGNVAEWEDSCEGPARWQYCRLRGGGFCQKLRGQHMACGLAQYGNNRDNNDMRYGFRCCSG